MKKTLKSTLLLCLTVVVLLSVVSCEMVASFLPFETTTTEETTAESTPDSTTPDVTIPEATTPEEIVTTAKPAEPIIPEPIVTTPAPDETTTEAPTETTFPDEPPVDNPDDPIIDLGGYTYRAYVRSNVNTGNAMQDGNPQFYCEDFWIDSSHCETDALSYAVYMRNMAIESTLNVKIEQVSQTRNMAEELAMFYQNGERFDLTIILAKSAAQAATQNLLQDLNSLPGLMLEESFYDQNSIRELSVANKLYYLSGDMNISTMDCITPTVVNLERYEWYVEAFIEAFENDLSFSNIYNLVTNGKWTVENMLTMAAIASVDADIDDGTLGNHVYDEVGYYQYAASTLYYFYGAGGRLTEINDEGVPEFVIQEEENQTIFDYLFDNMNKYNRDIPYPYGWSGARKTNFIQNANTLFTEMSLWDIRKDLYVNGDFEYGILPTPTLEEGAEYHSVVNFSNLAHLWAIPSNYNDLDVAQLMMAVMAASSDIAVSGSTMDAYYTRTLSFTVAPNPGARKAINIIKNSTVYDIALLYNWGGWATELEKLGERTVNNYGSLVSTMPYNAIPALEETIKMFQNSDSILE